MSIGRVKKTLRRVGEFTRRAVRKVGHVGYLAAHAAYNHGDLIAGGASAAALANAHYAGDYKGKDFVHKSLMNVAKVSLAANGVKKYIDHGNARNWS